MSFLSNLTSQDGARSKSKRLGRGRGSGKGDHTVGFGSKGQKSRGRGKVALGFEGGQVPLYKRMPQIGGFSARTKTVAVVNLAVFNRFKAATKVTPAMLVEEGIIKRVPKHGVKILGVGKLEKKITFEGFSFSKVAEEKIKDAQSTKVSRDKK